MRRRGKKKEKRWIIVFSIIGLVLVFSIINQFKDFNTETRNKIAVIPLSGVIGVTDNRLVGGGFVSSTDLVDMINKAGKDDNIKAVILEINSPGGTVVASEEIANAVEHLDKPVVAWIREVGASGAYWIASSADVIVADPLSITGSIGVISSYLQFSGLLEDYGIKYERLVSGDFKDTGSPYKNLSSKERVILQRKLDKIRDFFVNKVAENRNMSYDEVNNLATGMFYLGEEAKELGLVDVLGGKDEAIKITEDLANIKNAELVKFEKRSSIFDLFGRVSTKVFYYLGKGIGSNFDNQDLKIEAILK